MPNNNILIVGILALALLVTPSAARADIALTGRLEQGGIALGRAEPGASVTLDGRAVPADASGRFVIGFGREAPPEAVLEARSATGAVETRRLTVARREWRVQRIEGVPREKAEPDPAAVARIKAEADMLKAVRQAVSPVPLFLTGLAQPADGVVSGVFGSQRVYNGHPGAPHSGVDIAAPTGAPVRSVGDGVVVAASPDLFLTGGTILIDHGLGLVTSYAHLSRLDVRPGQRVGRGEPIGAVGATGLATGPHLHWGASWLDLRLDPETVMGVLGKAVE